MAKPLSGGDHDLEQSLKPFFQRASEAEDRLSRLEAALSSKKAHPDVRNEEHLKMISELQSKLDNANEVLVAERKKAEMLAAENAKLQYRIIHLVRTAARGTHQQLEQK